MRASLLRQTPQGIREHSMYPVIGIASACDGLIGNGVSSEIHHELAQPGPAQPSPFAEAAPEFVLFVLQDRSPIDWLVEEARSFLRVVPELLHHTVAQLLNYCRCEVFFLPPNPMDDGNCDALGHNLHLRPVTTVRFYSTRQRQ
ncbi:MAG: hypothetical protein DMG45_16920 [Acidobacteria bacterium]|nr:MAG: hypothetical protein DMG45_16920 [Acidobacteriota bacterium]PYT47032.1 MAG: hypothetical protein DMG47_02745 [Acidobacteriota bacterium]PYT55759.1 MAG: hypothetical protein DMG46_19190 [Acidobacteriota bacterium]